MSHFDTPNTGYGTYFNPVIIFTEVGWNQLEYVKDRCRALEINYERWFFNGKSGVIEELALVETLTAGVIVYFPQYNCIRNGAHIDNPEILSLYDFNLKLRKHPKHLGSFFIKTKDSGFREVIFTWFRTRGYKVFPGPMFDHETAVLINEPLKMMMPHRPERADENEKAGYYPVMDYEDFKIYME